MSLDLEQADAIVLCLEFRKLVLFKKGEKHGGRANSSAANLRERRIAQSRTLVMGWACKHQRW
jgi:hypothetical protein